ncbi:hypothetical protein ILUMI_05783 [Ignelater luminosus]|uniref:PiggyBac transposable element-derived protein domain-containing protein n=1 Tax=Ignelater luminosus TaxID=2038154 RepID=A0A8K0GJS4_IGNLU|nr:hypothetical protein ILUMI_05783 [Ignelater luminosus]
MACGRDCFDLFDRGSKKQKDTRLLLTQADLEKLMNDLSDSDNDIDGDQDDDPEANKRANEFVANQPAATRRNLRFQETDTTSEEMFSKQWSKNRLTHRPIFEKAMSCNRFTKILRMIRLVNYKNINTSDRLLKIRPVLSNLIQNIKNVYYPGQHLAIDETMVL